MQQSVFDHNNLSNSLSYNEDPSKLTLKAANGLSIPYKAYTVMDFEVNRVIIPGCGIVIVVIHCLSAPLLIGLGDIKTFCNPETRLEAVKFAVC